MILLKILFERIEYVNMLVHHSRVSFFDLESKYGGAEFGLIIMI